MLSPFKGDTLNTFDDCYLYWKRIYMNTINMTNNIYIVFENNSECCQIGPFPDAKAAIYKKYKKYLDEEFESASDYDISEDPSGESYFYIEKGIHIYIHRFALP